MYRNPSGRVVFKGNGEALLAYAHPQRGVLHAWVHRGCGIGKREVRKVSKAASISIAALATNVLW
jgi:hypothetical protein